MPIIRIEMLPGRTLDQKRELAEAVTRETARIAKCPKESVQVLISEIERDSWATAGVLASDVKKS